MPEITSFGPDLNANRGGPADARIRPVVPAIRDSAAPVVRTALSGIG